jgi:hypothetical protein
MRGTAMRCGGRRTATGAEAADEAGNNAGKELAADAGGGPVAGAEAGGERLSAGGA